MFTLQSKTHEIDVMFNHYNPGYVKLNGKTELRPFTRCVVWVDEWPKLYGLSICHPVDQFCKNTGRKLALADAIKDLPREKRRVFWQEYFRARGKVD